MTPALAPLARDRVGPATLALAPPPTLPRRGPSLPIPPSTAGRAGRRAADAAADDWDQLFAAVIDRLNRSPALASSVDADLRATVSECLQALTLLQGLRAGRRGRDRRLEVDLRRANGALAATQVELLQARLGEQQARHEARHDSLTSLPNRSSFCAQLDRAVERSGHPAPALAVLYLDLDDFKPINDHHGHPTGDELLRIVASRLSRSVRQQDMVCRLGGDEFAFILTEPQGREQLRQLAAKIFDAVSAPLMVGSLRLCVRPSIGIAMCPGDGVTATTLLKCADAAMYRAKRRQLGFAFFDQHADN